MKQKYYKVLIGNDEAILTPKEFAKAITTLPEGDALDGILAGFTLLNYKPDDYQDEGDKELTKLLKLK